MLNAIAVYSIDEQINSLHKAIKMLLLFYNATFSSSAVAEHLIVYCSRNRLAD